MSDSAFTWRDLAKEKFGEDIDRLAAINAIAPMMDWVMGRLEELRKESALNMSPAVPLAPGSDDEMFGPESA